MAGTHPPKQRSLKSRERLCCPRQRQRDTGIVRDRETKPPDCGHFKSHLEGAPGASVPIKR